MSIELIFLIISILLNVYLAIMLFRALNRIEMYEEWIIDIKNTILDAYLMMKKVDILGAFEASDEVGQSFKALLHISNQLNNKVNPEVSEEVINAEKSKSTNKINSKIRKSTSRPK